MSSVIYAIVFSGQIVESFQPISVKAHMAKMLKVDAEKMAVLFSGKQVVLKRTADKQEALKYATALKKVGADVRVRAIKTEAAPAPASAPKPAPAASTGPASDFSLAPPGGALTEPKPAPAPTEIDTSGLEILPNDNTPLSPAKPVEAIELDLSEYSVSDMDGAPLIPPAPPVPKLEAPDFGLDEPGAQLETLKDDRPAVAPDTSGLSLAAVGEDLLAAADKPATPPPPVPDTSAIQLLPNED